MGHNPEQPHIAADDTPINTLVAIFFDVEFLNNIAKSVANTSELSFENKSFEYDVCLKNMLNEFIKELKFKQCGYEREKALEERPFLKALGINTADDPNFILFRVVNGEAHFWTWEDNLKEADIPRIRF